MVAIDGIDELLLCLLLPLLFHYFLLILFGSSLISQFPIIYFVLLMGILHTHINKKIEFSHIIDGMNF